MRVQHAEFEDTNPLWKEKEKSFFIPPTLDKNAQASDCIESTPG